MQPVIAAFDFPLALVAWLLIALAVLITGSITRESGWGAGLAAAAAGLVGLWQATGYFRYDPKDLLAFQAHTTFTIYGYGLMLSLTFVVAAFLFFLELKRKGMDAEIVGPITILAVIFGLAGSKLFDALEHWDRFVQNPWKTFMNAGLAYLGGLFLATLAIIVYLRIRKISIIRVCDSNAPGLMIGYGIARIGCQLSGDGDYGIPTTLPWGMAYPNGTKPTTEIVHPTPVYETLASFILFAVLWRLRKRPAPDGWLFALYLIVSGAERFLIEFIRLNPRWMLGLTQAQLISLTLMAAGAYWMFRFRENPPTAPVSSGATRGGGRRKK